MTGDRGVLRFDDVSFAFRGRPALVHVAFSLAQRTRTGLVGVNGAGKSTLLTIAAGGRRPQQGQVHVGERELYGSGRRDALGRVSFMPQEATFPPRMTALEIVQYLTWMRGHAAADARRRAVAALEQVGLGAEQNTRFGQLSGGMRRRVALAQAVAPDTDVVLLDEPSTGLDPQQRRLMVQAVASLDGCVLMSSHVMEDVVAVASRVIVLHEGTVRFDGDLAELGGTAPGPGAAEAGFLALIESP